MLEVELPIGTAGARQPRQRDKNFGTRLFPRLDRAAAQSTYAMEHTLRA